MGSSSSSSFLLLLWLLLALATSSHSQSCVYEKDLKPLECKELIGDRPFLLPPKSFNVTKEDLILVARQGAFTLSLMSQSCREAALPFVCLSAFKPCNLNRLSEKLPNFFVIALPSLPCLSQCLRFQKECSEEIEEGKLPATDCYAISNTTDSPLYPKSKSVYTINENLVIDVPCGSLNHSLEIVPPEECPRPLILNTHLERLPICTTPCPLFYTEEKRDAIVVITLVFGFMSIACNVILLIGLLRLPEMLRFPAHLLTMIVFLNLIRTIVNVVMLLIQGQDLGCNNKYEIADLDNMGCAAQGFISILISYATTIICCCVIVAIALTVVFNLNLSTVDKLAIPSYAVSFGIPIVVSVGAISTNNLSGAPTVVFTCAISVSALGWFWASLGGVILAVSIAFIANALTIGTLSWSKARRASLSNNLSMISFVSVYIFMSVYSIAYGINGFVHRNVWRDQVIDMVRCSVTTRFLEPEKYDECDAAGPSFGYSVSYGIVFMGIGIWLLLAFLWHKRFVATWLSILGLKKLTSSTGSSKVTGLKGHSGGTDFEHSNSTGHSNS